MIEYSLFFMRYFCQIYSTNFDWMKNLSEKKNIDLLDLTYIDTNII